jgi:hypothetical protein
LRICGGIITRAASFSLSRSFASAPVSAPSPFAGIIGRGGGGAEAPTSTDDGTLKSPESRSRALGSRTDGAAAGAAAAAAAGAAAGASSPPLSFFCTGSFTTLTPTPASLSLSPSLLLLDDESA